MDWMKVYIGNFPKFRWYTGWLQTLFGYDVGIEPRRYVKIDDHDTWSMDNTLAHIVYPMLLQLRKVKHGATFVDMDDRPDHLIGTVPAPFEVDEYHFQAWDWVITEMIFAFHSKINNWKEDFYVGPIDDDARLDYQARVNNGFRLFGRYYENLWD